MTPVRKPFILYLYVTVSLEVFTYESCLPFFHCIVIPLRYFSGLPIPSYVITSPLYDVSLSFHVVSYPYVFVFFNALVDELYTCTFIMLPMLS